MTQDKKYLNFISGKWQEGSTKNWEPNINPADPTRILGHATCSNQKDIQAATASAEQAQKEWAITPRPMRGALLEKVAHIIESQIDKFARTMTEEEGKNRTEAKGEVLKTINSLKFTASEGRRPTGELIPSEMPNTLIYTARSPLGVVGIITPWNFPLCIPAWKIGPALLEGNAVVFKPSSLTPASATLLTEAFEEAFEEAGCPSGLLNLVHGPGSVIGNALVDDPKIQAISFTGSNEIGQALHEHASKRKIRIQLEMGGKNPILVLKDADLNQAVSATVMGAFGSTGQRCTATSRAIVEKSVYEIFKSKLLEKVRAIKVGDGIVNETAMGPVVDEKQFQSVLESIERAKKDLTLLCGGERVGNQGYFIAPTVFDNVSPEHFLAQEEIFGPVLALICVDSFEEAIHVANGVRYGLSSSIYTNDIQKILKYTDQIKTGMMHVNSATVGGEVQAPFGGMKATGHGGREMGSYGPEFFCEIKTIYMDYNSVARQGNLY